MKLSILISVLILIAGWMTGWHDQEVIVKLKEERKSMLSEVLRIERQHEGLFEKGLIPTRLSEREHRADFDVSAFAGELVKCVTAEAERKNDDSLRSADEEEKLKEEMMKVLRRFLDLENRELEMLIEELGKDGEWNQEECRSIRILALHLMNRNDPSRVIELVTGPEFEGVQEGGVRSITMSALQQWAAISPLEALEWMRTAETERPDFVDEDCKFQVLLSVMREDPQLGYKTLIEFGLDKGSMIGEDLSEAMFGAEEHIALLESFRDYANDEAGKEILYEQLRASAGGVADAGYEHTMQWLESTDLSPDEEAHFASGVAGHYHGEDTAKWMEWLSERQDGDPADVERLMTEWTKGDFIQAGEWLNTTENGPVRNTAIRSYAKTLAPYYPETAAEWAGSLPVGEKRRELAAAIYGEWEKADPHAAAAYASREGLSLMPDQE